MKDDWKVGILPRSLGWPAESLTIGEHTAWVWEANPATRFHAGTHEWLYRIDGPNAPTDGFGMATSNFVRGNRGVAKATASRRLKQLIGGRP